MKILDKINELANREKVQLLTVAGEQEQHALRQDYLSMVRRRVLTTFPIIKVVDPIGRGVTPDKVYDLRQQYGYIRDQYLLTRYYTQGAN